MIIIERFKRGATPRHQPTAPLNQNRHLMSASTPHVGAFACSLCWSSAPIMLAHRLKQQANLQKIGPANLKVSLS